jgi:Caspase domain
MTLYALCAGISDYSQWRSIGWNTPDLPCSVKNAEDFAQVLMTGFGAQAANIGIQRDSWCSSGNFLTALSDLLQKAQPGDSLCVFFSGHGARIVGSAIPDKPAELWYDAILPYAGSAVTDYDFAALTNSLDSSKVSLTVILDTSFVGGIRPVPGAPQPIGVGLDDSDKPNFTQYCHTIVPMGLCLQNPMSTIAGNVSSISQNPNGQLAITLPDSAHQVDAAKAVLYTASAPDEVSWQLNDPKNQDLQNSIFVKAWKQVIASGNPPLSLNHTDLLTQLRTQCSQLMTQNVNRMASYAHYTQVPQLYGASTLLSQTALTSNAASVSG